MIEEPRNERILDVDIEREMRKAYLDYAMSVIVDRALPDVRDGLKPVQRRILWTMSEMGLSANRPTRKSANIVGEVMGRYHPHGDAPIYDALVRLAQPFSMRYPLITGQGNFGSIDDDPPAHMRYTEAKLSSLSQEMLGDIDKQTVGFAPNNTNRLQQPTVLPTKVPNLILNGAAGIAVGMATNIPPHNLREIADAIKQLLDDPESTADDLCEIVKGPDFPGGGVIYRYEEQKNVETGALERVDVIRRAYANGRGRILMRSLAHTETLRGNREAIVVTEIPYAVNKAGLIEKIAELVNAKRLDGISDIRDESDREGMRIVIERRTQYDLDRAKERAHILEGLKIAHANLDAIIKMIRAHRGAEPLLVEKLRDAFKLSEAQAKAILDMQLRRLSQLERAKLDEDYETTIKLIAELESILGSPRKVLRIITTELDQLVDKFGDDRRTKILDDASRELSAEDLVADEDVVVTISGRNYIKRVPLSTFKQQHRGGRGVTGMQVREEDEIEHLVVCRTHDRIYFFTERGRVFAPTRPTQGQLGLSG